MARIPHSKGFWWRLAYLWFGYAIVVIFLSAGTAFVSAFLWRYVGWILWTISGQDVLPSSPVYASALPIACGVVVAALLTFVGIGTIPEEARYRSGAIDNGGDGN